jgi:hypothetical protein
VAVAFPTRCLSERSRSIAETSGVIRQRLGVSYADGERVVTRTHEGGQVHYASRPVRVCAGGEATPLDVAESAIVRYLTVRASNVYPVGTAYGFRFRVVGRDATHPSLDGITDYRMTAAVTPRGAIEELTARYDVPMGNGTRSVVIGFEYGPLDLAMVGPPGWHDDARAALVSEESGVSANTMTETADGAVTVPPVVGGVGCGGFDCEQFPGGEAVGVERSTV